MYLAAGMILLSVCVGQMVVHPYSKRAGHEGGIEAIISLLVEKALRSVRGFR